MSNPSSWKVLLIGGHSGAGKSVVARELATRLKVNLAEADDFRLVLERMTTSQQQPTLHSLLAAQKNSDLTPSELFKQLIAAAETISYALEIVVANHVATNAPLILEGDGILPAFAAQKVFADLGVKDTLRSVFLIEEDKARFLASTTKRRRGFENLTPADQQRQIQLSWLYGQWLKQEAQHYDLPIIAPPPWDTLADRIIEAV